MENPDLVLQETGSRPTYSRLNYVQSGDTLHRDAISSLILLQVYPRFKIEIRLLISKSNFKLRIYGRILSGKPLKNCRDCAYLLININEASP